MVKEKDKIVNEMMQLISNMNCSDSHCEDCSFKSHCCMCVRALEVLYDNGYRNILTSFNKLRQDMEREIDMRVLEELDNVRKETVNDIMIELINSCQYTFNIVGAPIIALSGDFALNIAKRYKLDLEKKYEK